jgi:CxxC motif-containing protein (DUF1111 family)
MPPSVVVAVLLSWSTACVPHGDPVTGEPGEPLPGLAQAALGRFQAGRALFDKVYTPEEGLGPAFNENQCSACHTVPASGGTSGFERVVRATRFTEAGDCDLLLSRGGENVRSQATPLLKARGVTSETIPPHATEIGRFTPPFLFGLGLIEAIPEPVIVARHDPDDADGDGISGRGGRTPDGRLARFGRKAEFATIREFVESALRLEMGLTTRATHVETLNGGPLPQGTDPVPEPEVDSGTVDLLTTFVRLLAAPAPAPPRSAAHHDTVTVGRRLFHRLGCAACHVPTLRTGRADVATLSQKSLDLYSDLLLHDMGPTLASVCGHVATPLETRTEPLMGLGRRDLFLHDGRTSDLTEAILAHGGEAQAARDAFARLPWLRQHYVLTFLRSL